MPVLVGVFEALARAVPAFATATDASDVVVRIALKAPPILADVAIAAGLAVLLRQARPLGVAVVLAFLLLPATWYLGAVCAQFDTIYVAFCCWRSSSGDGCPTTSSPSPRLPGDDDPPGGRGLDRDAGTSRCRRYTRRNMTHPFVAQH